MNTGLKRDKLFNNILHSVKVHDNESMKRLVYEKIYERRGIVTGHGDETR